MTGDLVLYLGRRTLEVAMMMSAPILAVTLVLGILVSLFQAVTSMRDMSLSVVIKLVGVGVTALVAGGWMLQQAVGFTKEIFETMRAMME